MFRRAARQVASPPRGRANTRARLESLARRFPSEVVLRVSHTLWGRTAAAAADRTGRGSDGEFQNILRTFTAATDPADPYLPWLAAQFNRIRRLGARALAAAASDNHEEEVLASTYSAYYTLAENFSSIVDWARAEHVDLGPLSFVVASERAQAWHRQLPAIPARVGGGKVGKIVRSWPDGWTLQVLPVVELERESQTLHHCVARLYREHARKGLLLSLRDGRNVPHVTVELTPDGIEQVKGYDNISPWGWPEELGTVLRPRLVKALTALRRDQSTWSSEARQLLVAPDDVMGLIFDGKLGEAYGLAHYMGNKDLRRGISNLQSLLNPEGYEEEVGAESKYSIVAGQIEFTWWVPLSALKYMGKNLRHHDTGDGKDAHRGFHAACRQHLSPRHLAALAKRAYPLADAVDFPDAELMKEAVVQAIAEYVLSNTFRCAWFEYRRTSQGGKYVDTRIRGREVNSRGWPVALRGTFKVALPASVEDMERFDADDAPELRDWTNDALPHTYDLPDMAYANNMVDRVVEAIEALEGHLPPAGISAPDMHRYLEAHGQIVGNPAGNANRRRR